MPIFLLKSLLAIPLFISALVAVITMFEVYGRAEKPRDPKPLVMVHRVNGAVFIALFLVLSGLCVKVVIDTGTDLGPRAALHSLAGVACFTLLAFKVAVVLRYRGFYAKLPSAGLWLSALTFLLIFSSAGYFFLVSDLAREGSVAKPKAMAGKQAATEVGSLAEGQVLFRTKCASCHYAESEKKLTGPGLKGVLKNPELPSSKKPATPENVREQIVHPYMLMPSFSNLPEADIERLIAYLKTL